MTKMVEWALAYAVAGFAVMPVYAVSEDGEHCTCDRAIEPDEKGEVCDRPAKHPIPKQGIKQATTDPSRIKSWWNQHPRANIGIATGEVSGLIAIDVDISGGKSGDVSLTRATADHGGVPVTLKARSGSGGPHYWYRYRKTKFTRKIGFLKDVDYLADGGYVIAFPSVNLKGQYLFDSEADIRSPQDIARLRGEMAELPDWFDELTDKTENGRKKRKAGSSANKASGRLAAAFNPEDPNWIEELRAALAACDPDDRDLWVQFGVILGRTFNRSDDGWALYEEWSSRSGKFADKGTQKSMRDYYYVVSNEAPQSGKEATVGTIFHHAIEAGFQMTLGGPAARSRTQLTYLPGTAIESSRVIVEALNRERVEGRGARVYAYGSGLAEVIESHDGGAIYTGSGAPPNGWLLKALPYTPILLGSRVTSAVTIVKFSATNQPSVVECPPEITSYILANCGRHFPRLNGIVQWPLLIDGRVVGVDEDYDVQAGLLFVLPKDADFTSLKADEAAAREAWRWIREEAFEDFPFDTPADEAAALSMLLTFMQRRAMETSPAFLVTAPLRGTGKTSLIKFASEAVHGRKVGAGALSLNEEEQRKSITAALMNNPPALLFDNLQAGSVFDSNELAIAMTSGTWEDRKLGSTERLVLPNRAVWCFTGNNVSLSGDMRRRVVRIRMNPPTRAHFTKHFSRNLEVWPRENRLKILKALVTIALWASGQRRELPGESGFPAWDEAVRWPTLAITGQDPYRGASTETEEEDPIEEGVGTLMAAWAIFMGSETGKVRDFMSAVDDGAKSSDSNRRSWAEQVPPAIALIRGKEVRNVSQLDYGYAVKSLADRLTWIAEGESAFRFVGLRNNVATWKLDGAARIRANIEKDF